MSCLFRTISSVEVCMNDLNIVPHSTSVKVYVIDSWPFGPQSHNYCLSTKQTMAMPQTFDDTASTLTNKIKLSVDQKKETNRQTNKQKESET